MTAVSFAMLNTWADRLLPVARAAGVATLDVRKRGFEVLAKNDASPVTEADQIAEGIITPVLDTLGFPIVAEERMAAEGGASFDGNTFWLVDALDGTKEFIKGGDDYTVNIALVVDGVPALGLVHAPVRDETFLGVMLGAERRAEVWRGGKAQKIGVRPRPKRIIVTGSKSHEVPALMDPFLARYDVAEKLPVGSSLKFCLVAEGKADIYPRFGPTCEWDIAAGHAVLRAAGGRVHDFEGAEITYKKPQFLNGRFLAEGPSAERQT